MIIQGIIFAVPGFYVDIVISTFCSNNYTVINSFTTLPGGVMKQQSYKIRAP